MKNTRIFVLYVTFFAFLFGTSFTSYTSPAAATSPSGIYTATPPNLHTASEWAHSHITSALERGLLQGKLLNDYQRPITRGEFVHLAMTYLRYYTQMEDERLLSSLQLSRVFFTDTDDPVIQTAAALGITAGVGGGRFGVQDQFNREQAAVMLRNVFSFLGLTSQTPPPIGFIDLHLASEWARDAINFAGKIGIMSGIGGGRFNPEGTFSIEQSIAVFNQAPKSPLIHLANQEQQGHSETEEDFAPQDEPPLETERPPADTICADDCVDGIVTLTCEECDGEGRVSITCAACPEAQAPPPPSPLPPPFPCLHCSGSGIITETITILCLSCDGLGHTATTGICVTCAPARIICRTCGGDFEGFGCTECEEGMARLPSSIDPSQCPDCSGTQTGVIHQPCGDCNANGTRTTETTAVCPHCYGVNSPLTQHSSPSAHLSSPPVCVLCFGAGERFAVCRSCSGSGVRREICRKC